jgi:hypothetical protein
LVIERIGGGTAAGARSAAFVLIVYRFLQVKRA